MVCSPHREALSWWKVTTGMRATILVAVVAVLAALCARTLGNATPICPHDPHACYFSDGYSSARARFRAAALGANATLHTLSLPTGKDLTIDVAVLSAGTEADDPFVVETAREKVTRVTAAWGVEGPADTPSREDDPAVIERTSHSE